MELDQFHDIQKAMGATTQDKMHSVEGVAHLPNYGTYAPAKEIISHGWGTPIHGAPLSETATGTY